MIYPKNSVLFLFLNAFFFVVDAYHFESLQAQNGPFFGGFVLSLIIICIQNGSS